MAFIRTRKLKYDDENRIVSGTAAIIECHYIPGNVKNHPKMSQKVTLHGILLVWHQKNVDFMFERFLLVTPHGNTINF